MKKIVKFLNAGLLAAILAACWGEFFLCFARGYEELWYTILVPSAILTVLCAFACKTRFKWLYFISTAILLAGAVLMIGFPAYVMFLALVLGVLSLAAEIFWLAIKIRQKCVG